MEVYLVRVAETHVIVGLFAVPNMEVLFDFVDEFTDPYGCEAAIVESGFGFMYSENFTANKIKALEDECGLDDYLGPKEHTQSVYDLTLDADDQELTWLPFGREHSWVWRKGEEASEGEPT